MDAALSTIVSEIGRSPRSSDVEDMAGVGNADSTVGQVPDLAALRMVGRNSAVRDAKENSNVVAALNSISGANVITYFEVKPAPPPAPVAKAE